MRIFLGANLLPEGLETGEYKVEETFEIDDLEPINVVAYSGEKIPAGVAGNVEIDLIQGGYTINGISSSIVFLLTTNEWYTVLMNNLQKSNYSDYIVACFTVPKLAIKDFLTENYRLDPVLMNYPVYALGNGINSQTSFLQTPTLKTLNSRPSSIDGYTPRNKKVLSYPYLYLGFNPVSGSSKVFRYEDFENGSPSFKIISEVNPNPTINFIPLNYRGSTDESLSDIVSLNGYPTLSQRNDTFNVWLAQNGNIIGLQMQQEQFNYEVGQISSLIGGMGNLIGNGISGNYIGMASDVINSGINLFTKHVNHDFYIKQQMAQIEKQKLLPDKVSLSNSNATLLGYEFIDKNIMTIYSIKSQFAERIDKFFDMYGYLTNQVKIPNTNNRPNWNYIKTIGCNIIGNIPQIDLESIKSMFDNGITLWHNPTTFLDYSQNNR